VRIAQIAPLHESVPPKLYGGTERVVHYLTEELVRQGHEVTLFASADSNTTAKLEAVCERSLRLDPRCVDPLAHHMRLVDRVLTLAERFDLLHFHIDYLHFPTSRRQRVPHVTTLHGRLDLPDLEPLYRQFADVPVVSISDAQRQPLPWLNWVGTVHHGMPGDLLALEERPGDYVAFLGRTSPEKGIEAAIEIAQRAGVLLRIAAKVDAVDRVYFERSVRPLLDRPGVEFLGEIDESGKQLFLSGARALLFPIDWAEPFGLVMIEAMACGTPVIAFSRGSVPEVIDEGVTGFVCATADEAVTAVHRSVAFDRSRCRATFERRFLAARMATDYVAVYERVRAAAEAGGARKRVATHALLPQPRVDGVDEGRAAHSGQEGA
jgi:glycosyltransferase involved in cell wall biosynthesis